MLLANSLFAAQIVRPTQFDRSGFQQQYQSASSDLPAKFFGTNFPKKSPTFWLEFSLEENDVFATVTCATKNGGVDLTECCSLNGNLGKFDLVAGLQISAPEMRLSLAWAYPRLRKKRLALPCSMDEACSRRGGVHSCLRGSTNSWLVASTCNQTFLLLSRFGIFIY